MHPLVLLRYEKGISQQQLADELGMYQGNVCSWEQGKVIPSSKSMYKLARYFEKDINELYQIFPLDKKK